MGSSSNEGPPAQSPSPSSVLPPLSGAGLDDLLRELLIRVDGVVQDQRRLRLLLDAVVGIAADLSLDSVLARIVQVASELADARYAALGVLGRAARSSRCARSSTTASATSSGQLIGDLPARARPARPDHRPARAAAAARHRRAPRVVRLPASTTRRCARSWASRSGSATGCSATSTSPRRPGAATSPSRTRRSSWRSPPPPAS